MKNEIVMQLVEHFSGQAAAAEALGVKQPTVSAWLNRIHGISPISALRIERITEGRFKASDLCPGLQDFDLQSIHD